MSWTRSKMGPSSKLSITFEPALFCSVLLLAQDFFGMDEGFFRKALSVLENQGRAVIFKGATSEEDGVKFLA